MEVPANIIPRDHYLQQVLPFVGQNLIKVLTGQRRVGKSYLLFQLMQHILQQEPSASVIYINKEDLRFDAIRNANDLNDFVTAQLRKDQRNYIFIDEIQDIENFEKALRSLLLSTENDLYITGSNATMLSGELATYLSGRYIEFTVYSLSYPEFLRFHGLTDEDTHLELYMRFGGLPYLVNLPLADHAFEYIKGVYSTIVYRDVVSRFNIRNTQFLEKLIQFLAGQIGSLFSAKRISDFLKSQRVNLAPNQIQQYVSYLASAFIIHEVGRYDLIGKRVFEIGNKYYFENTGIRNAISGYTAADRGKLLENVVYNHLTFCRYSVKVGTLQALEIDFMGERRGEKVYVQVALSLVEQETITREFGNLLKIDDNYPKYVVSNDSFSGNTYQGIIHLTIREFLMQLR
ncbi:MAG TPA: ATP-binding protein [Parapedobacter sp.]|uniref:ATP-binding protein n=1 Tax=Parapedobacter sp. TaxID=1958893 RepID=UPI002BC48E81|nr:ATP-binding protein [Parapedobacter sp.]HWK57471.1 ATP-binding protein [Parapedobacter sp.]